MNLFPLPACVVTVISLAACGSQPLDPGEEEPLLLEDEPAPSLPDSRVDNSRCHVCHANYALEELALVHARAGMSCARCHGDCDAHIADESWSWGGTGTPPEVMFSRAMINPFCVECHPGEELDLKHSADLLVNLSGNRYCTDCHGEHRLTRRKQNWKAARTVVGGSIE